MQNTTAILFANEAFYAAFNSGDINAMRDSWSKTFEITCIPPGWPRLSGQNEVMRSWESILNSEERTEIICKAPSVKVVDNVAFVICYEMIQKEFLLATNIYLRETKRWRLIHHQAAQTISPTKVEENVENFPTETIQ